MKTKYRIIRKWTTKTNTITGRIEMGSDEYVIQFRNFLTLFFHDSGWEDYSLISYDTLEEAKDALDRILMKKAIKVENHTEVLFTLK
jgi:hypothetical protein